MELQEPSAGAAAPEARLEDALAALHNSPWPALPIVEPTTGRVLAVLSRPQPAPPPRLGGMATPLGVYLTDGVVSGGAGFWGLFLTGLLLCAIGLAAQGLAQSVLHPAARIAPALRPALGELLNAAPLLLIFGLLRLLPLSGTHAAEHQVVHCVERGTPLEPQWVRAMPRVHPRCGTNLVVGVSLFLFVFVTVFGLAQSQGWGVTDAATVSLLLAAPPTLTLWRRLGGFVQQWLATRPATDPQIAGAIRAAQEVLTRRRSLDTGGAGRAVRYRLLRRLWSMGLVQVACGYFAVLLPLTLAARHWPAVRAALGM